MLRPTVDRFVHVQRVAKAWLDITGGYSQNVDSILGQALFDEPTVSSGGGGIVLVRNHATFAQSANMTNDLLLRLCTATTCETI